MPQYCANFHTPRIKNLGHTGPRIDPIIDRKVPGPGTYQPPSDFGYIEPIKDNNNSIFKASRLNTSNVTPRGDPNAASI
jgi:hypothetical protein